MEFSKVVRIESLTNYIPLDSSRRALSRTGEIRTTSSELFSAILGRTQSWKMKNFEFLRAAHQSTWNFLLIPKIPLFDSWKSFFTTLMVECLTKIILLNVCGDSKHGYQSRIQTFEVSLEPKKPEISRSYKENPRQFDIKVIPIGFLKKKKKSVFITVLQRSPINRNSTENDSSCKITARNILFSISES